MRISLIITTACGDPLVYDQDTGAGDRSMGHNDRAELLISEILPAALREPLDEIFVAGRPHDAVRESVGDDRVTFLEVPPRRRDRAEALHIRDIATRYSTGDLLIYAADDHKLGEGFVDGLVQLADGDWDVLTPQRRHGEEDVVMNDGEDHLGGYSPLHTHVLRRAVWAQCPWQSIDTEYIDVSQSRIWEENGFTLEWTDEIHCIDVEAQPGER